MAFCNLGAKREPMAPNQQDALGKKCLPVWMKDKAPGRLGLAPSQMHMSNFSAIYCKHLLLHSFQWNMEDCVIFLNTLEFSTLVMWCEVNDNTLWCMRSSSETALQSSNTSLFSITLHHQLPRSSTQQPLFTPLWRAITRETQHWRCRPECYSTTHSHRRILTHSFPFLFFLQYQSTPKSVFQHGCALWHNLPTSCYYMHATTKPEKKSQLD